MSRLNDHEINNILKEYDSYITAMTYKLVPHINCSFSVPIQDIIQEVRIHLFYLLRDKYDSHVGSVERFVKGFLGNIIKGVMTRISISLKETGIENSRSQIREMQKHCIYLETQHDIDRKLDYGVIIEKYGDNEYINSDPAGTDILFQFLNSDDLIDIEIDRPVIIAKIKKKLKEASYLTFECVYLFGYNYAETSKMTGQHPSTISKQITNKIIPAIKEALQETGYL